MSKQIETQPAAVPDGLHWGKYIKPYLLYFIAGPILMIVEVLGEVLMPRFLAYIIDYGVSGEAENAPAFEMARAYLMKLAGAENVIVQQDKNGIPKGAVNAVCAMGEAFIPLDLSLIHISEPTRPY